MWSISLRRALAVTLGCVGCATACASPVDESEESQDELATFTAPAEGSCEARAMLKVANESDRATLVGPVRLSRPAADAIIAARTIATVAALDAVAQVGPAALKAILSAADVGACSVSPNEIGIISDLDDTVIPAAKPDLSIAPFPGVAALYHLLDDRNGGKPSDVFYVTARKPERVLLVPAYLSTHGVPGAQLERFETGTSGFAPVAIPEKVRDIERILARTGTQRFAFFGDTADGDKGAVDPDVQRQILAKHPDRMIAGIILETKPMKDPKRLEGLHLVSNYAEAAAVFFKLGAITRAEALGVMSAARGQGLVLTDAQMNDLLTTSP